VTNLPHFIGGLINMFPYNLSKYNSKTPYYSKAPLSYQKYWWLEDNEGELMEVAKDILMGYIQNWSIQKLKNLKVLKRTLKSVGVRKEKLQQQLIDDLGKIRRDNFEDEVVQICELIKKYKDKSKRLFGLW